MEYTLRECVGVDIFRGQLGFPQCRLYCQRLLENLS